MPAATRSPKLDFRVLSCPDTRYDFYATNNVQGVQRGDLTQAVIKRNSNLSVTQKFKIMMLLPVMEMFDMLATILYKITLQTTNKNGTVTVFLEASDKKLLGGGMG